MVFICTRCDSNYVGKTKISLVQDRRLTDLSGINQNQILTKKIYQMKMHCIGTTILRTIYRDLILMTHTKLLFWKNQILRFLNIKNIFG